MKLRVFLSSVVVLVFAFAVVAQQKVQTDEIRILNVAPAAPVQDGVKNEFTVEVEYKLDSADEAFASIGFNSDDPGRYRMVGKKRITRGSGTITLKAVAVPKDWKERGDFIVLVNIAPIEVRSGRYRPFAGAEHVITFDQ